jgi:DNA polymerase III gamma/tau subunit
MVQKKYKLTSVEKQITDLLSHLKEKDSQKAFKLVADLMETGVYVKYFLEQLINKLHLSLLEKVGVFEKSDKSSGLEIHEIKKLVDLFSKAYLDTKYSVLEQLPLELAIIEWTQEDGTKEGSEKLEMSPLVDGLESSAKTSSTSFQELQPAATSDLNKLFEELLEKVKPLNHSVAGVLRGCSMKSYIDNKLTIETKYKFHKEKLEEVKIRKLIEEVAGEITGDKVNFFVLLRG